MVEAEGATVTIGEYALVDHHAFVHGAKVDDWVIIGIRAIIVRGSHVGEGAIVDSGSVIPTNMEIPPYKLVSGLPATVKRSLTEEEIRYSREVSRKLNKKAFIYERLRFP